MWSDAQRRSEPGLFGSKWFDYRELHVVRATYLFASLFTNETRKIIRAHIDNTPARVRPDGSVIDWHPIKAGDIFDAPDTRDDRRIRFWQRKISSLIKARQFADTHGVPYDLFVRAGLKHWYFGRAYFMEQRKLPEPGMFNGDECREAIIEAWGQAIEGQIQFAHTPRFQVSKNNHPDVADHQQWLLDQMARKSDPTFAIRKFIDKGLLSEPLARARFGSERIARALCTHRQITR